MTRFEARAILNDCDLLGTEDFFTLPASTVGTLIDHADRLKYRKPKKANGSRGRYFYARVQRALNAA